MSKFNKSHLNQKFTLKILNACRESLNNGIAYVKNRNGQYIIKVKFKKGKFLIVDLRKRSITKHIRKKAIQSNLSGLLQFSVNHLSLFGG